jgi:predicted DNA-binding protein
MRKLRVNIFISPKQKADLEKLSEKTGAPVAELVRRAIDAYLKANK